MPATTLTSKGQVTIPLALRKAVGLSDALIAHIGEDQGCIHTVSFDKGAVRWAGMQLLV